MIDKPFNEHIDLAVYADGRLELDMSFAQYNEFNNYTRREEGVDLSELAERDPSHAYTLVKRMIGSVAASVTCVSINEQPLVRRDADGSELTSDTARSIISGKMPESYERKIQFSLGVYASEEDALLFGDSALDRMSILDFTVEPPDFS